jgi:Ca2+-binding EF-hand superfamily protein
MKRYCSESFRNGEKHGTKQEGETMISSVGSASLNIQSLFSKIDSSGDGAISLEEFQAGAPEKPEGVSAPEQGPSIEEIFAESDTDGDGFLSSEEFEAGAPKGPPPGPPPGELSGESILLLNGEDEEDAIVQSILDAIENGSSDEDSVSATEDEVDALTSFFDADQNGEVTEEEVENGLEKIRAEMMSYLISNQEVPYDIAYAS